LFQESAAEGGRIWLIELPFSSVQSNGMTESLERAFDLAMHELYAKIVRECAGRYHPTVFHDMLERYGGLETAHRLLKPDADFFSYGFQRLCELEKPHLTMEAMILDVDYARGLFSPEELAIARERLDAGTQLYGERR
jgi:hypothetical protein